MKLVLILGILISALGLLGLISCIMKGIKVKRLEEAEKHNQEKLKKLLGQLYFRNMLSLSCSLLGLIMVTVSLILES